MNDEKIVERLTSVESSTKSAHKRIDEMGAVVNSINELSKNVAVMVTEMKYTKEEVQNNNKEVKELKATVETLNRKDAAAYKNIKKSFINAFIGAMAAAIASGMIYLINLNF